jgi:dihydroneopterin aldolase
MRSPQLDKILCRGFSYDCEIGFHDCELAVVQRIAVDLVAWVSPIPVAERDQESALRFDYDQANRLLKQLCAGGRVRLIETLAERIATALLHSFAIQAIEVTVSKFPLGMPNVQSVAYVCYRESGAPAASESGFAGS